MIKHNDRNIKEVLNEMIHSNKRINRGYDSVRLKEAWKSEMGEMISGYTEKLNFYQGVLTVNLSSAPLRNELSMSKPKVIQVLNEACKEDLIKDIIFR
mgnify:CR=1 FL=1